MSITYYKVEDNLCSREYEQPLFAHAFRTRKEALDAAEQWLRESRFWHWEEETRRADPEATHIVRGETYLVIAGLVQVRDWPPAVESIKTIVVAGEEYSREVTERPSPGPWRPSMQDAPTLAGPSHKEQEQWRGYGLEVKEYGLVWWDERSTAADI